MTSRHGVSNRDPKEEDFYLKAITRASRNSGKDNHLTLQPPGFTYKMATVRTDRSISNADQKDSHPKQESSDRQVSMSS